MAVFGAVVEPLVRAVFDTRRNLAFGRAVGSQLVGDEALWGLGHVASLAVQAGVSPP